MKPYEIGVFDLVILILEWQFFGNNELLTHLETYLQNFLQRLNNLLTGLGFKVSKTNFILEY